MNETDKIIEVRHLSKSFSGKKVLEDINLYIRRGEFLTLLGPSGCGKTTMLRMIAGFLQPDEGSILLEGKELAGTPPHLRPLNTVFQRYALFPHMNIYENIAFGLRQKKMAEDVIQKKVKRVLELVDLEGFERRSVSTLSGGQQQRIAIARALVNEPEILLLDEPLGALDLKMRKEMQLELKEMHDRLGITFIYVTHDQEEALTMSDTIVVMSEGRIQQIGTPEMIYNEPKNAFVADFIGESNIIDGVMIKDKLVEILGARWDCVDTGFGENTPVDVVIRPEDVILKKPGKGVIDGEVISLIFKGVHSTSFFPVGDKVSINVDPFNIQIMNKPASEDEEALAVDE